MGTSNKETIRAYTYLIILATVITLARSNAPSSITYECDENGVSSIQEPDFNHFAIISGDPSNRKYCKPTDANLFATCSEAKQQQSITLLYEEVKAGIMIGGKIHTYYKLNCNNGATLVTKTGTFTAKAVKTISNVLTHNITHSFELQLIKGDDKGTGPITVNIGEKLTLKMTGKDVVINPTICYAYPSGDIQSKVTIWELVDNNGNKQCRNNDQAIIGSEKWSKKDTLKPDIEIELYAFRFVQTSEVKISCSALVCSTKSYAECLQTCVDGGITTLPPTKSSTTHVTASPAPTSNTGAPQLGGRKRRSLVGKEYSRRILSSSVSFSIRDNEALLNSSPGFSVGNTKFVTVGLVVLFVILPKY